jgi:hypothetical protein
MQTSVERIEGTECRHARLDFLGEDSGRNRYFLCRSCEAVVIHDGMRTWVLHPEE